MKPDSTKYVVILCDGMADYPIKEFGGKTPLQYAKTPNMDFLADKSEIGMVKTVPDGIAPGSDSANLSVMGYDPKKYYSGRSPLEAASMGVTLDKNDISFRCNLVTLSEEQDYDSKIMIDYSSDEISTEESREIIADVNKHFENDFIRFYPGISYRHLMVWKNGPQDFDFTPPHDILEKKISGYLPGGAHRNFILSMMVESYEFLKNHPVNLNRIARGLRPANSIWIWGEGKKPSIPEFYDKYGIHGSVISAVDLIKGIGVCAGMRTVEVEGATGNIHTNFSGKAEAALNELKSGRDFVYIHVEAPDECGHRYEIENKAKSIELIDEKILGPVIKEMDKCGYDYKIMILPDHPTPLSLRTHTAEPVPYMIYHKNKPLEKPGQVYSETGAASAGILINDGFRLMDHFLGR